MTKTLIAFVLAFTGAALFADANAFNYQATLRDASGNVLSTRNQTVTVRLYGVPTGGSVLWARQYNVYLSETGLFSLAISDDEGSFVGGGTLADVLKDHTAGSLYVGLLVKDSSGEISPRQRLLAVPYASVANKALALENDGAVFVPVGGIIMWTKESLPDSTHWAICNGQNGTPDLRDRFLVGAGNSYSVGSTGGEATHKLTVDEMPIHSHSYQESTTYRGTFTVVRNYPWTEDTSKNCYALVENTYNNGATTGSAGSGGAHENRPPYYALYYIMRIK